MNLSTMLPMTARIERLELHARVEPVAELRAEHVLVGLVVVARLAALAEADARLRQIPRADVAGHDQDHVAEVALLAVVVGERAVVHHLEEHLEHVRVRLLDLVEQEHRVRRLRDRLGEQAAAIEADVAGRRADEPRDGVPLLVLAHVEADEPDAERLGELLGELGLADAGRAREEERADGLLGRAQPRARRA